MGADPREKSRENPHSNTYTDADNNILGSYSHPDPDCYQHPAAHPDQHHYPEQSEWHGNGLCCH